MLGNLYMKMEFILGKSGKVDRRTNFPSDDVLGFLPGT